MENQTPAGFDNEIHPLAHPRDVYIIFYLSFKHETWFC